MDRDVSRRIDGMLTAIRGNLDALALYVKNNCTEAESKRIIRQIGAAMGETIDISNALYQEHPDIVPRELKAPGT
jgi:uroporphyrinogen-III decarboxylase